MTLVVVGVQRIKTAKTIVGRGIVARGILRGACERAGWGMPGLVIGPGVLGGWRRDGYQALLIVAHEIFGEGLADAERIVFVFRRAGLERRGLEGHQEILVEMAERNVR